MNSLNNLLAHEIVDLYSAEEQIIQALPQMIEKAQDQELKKGLKDHLRVTEQQKKRLEKVHKLLQENEESEEELGDTECLGMKGLIEEGKKMLAEEMDPDVMDAAIIASAQKIEHYEICGYGTVCAYARELGLSEVEKLLQQSLDEEYQADDLLTDMAVGGLNQEAEGEERINVRKLPQERNRAGRGAGSQRASSATSRSTNQSSSRSTANSNGKRGSRSTGRTKKSATAGGRKPATTKSKSASASSSRSRKSSRSR